MRAGGTGGAPPALLALGFCCWSCWCPSPSVGTEQSFRELWSHGMPFGSWTGLGVPRQGAIGGSSSYFLVPPGVVCGWAGAVSQPGRAVSSSLLGHCPRHRLEPGSGAAGSPCPSSALKASPQSEAIVPGWDERHAGSGVTLLQLLLCRVRCCPALRTAPAQALCSWAWADSAALGPPGREGWLPAGLCPPPAQHCHPVQGASGELKKHRRHLGRGHVAGDAFAMSL